MRRLISTVRRVRISCGLANVVGVCDDISRCIGGINSVMHNPINNHIDQSGPVMQ